MQSVILLLLSAIGVMIGTWLQSGTIAIISFTVGMGGRLPKRTKTGSEGCSRIF